MVECPCSGINRRVFYDLRWKARRENERGTAPEPIIGLAKELRRDYAAVSRTSKYSSSGDDETLRSKVKSTVQSLQSSLHSGELNLNGTQFHSLCLTRMEQINESRPEGAPDRAAFLKGCMYDIADRCLLRFERSN